MSAFRLDTFLPSSGPVPARIDPVARRIEAEREAAYHAGFLDGQALATEGFLEEEGRLTSELVEAIADARLTNEAARRHVAASIAPMVEALTAGITPVLAEAGIGAEVARLVSRALAVAPEARPRLRCAAELAPRLEKLLRARDLDAEIEPAPELLPREARIFWDQGYDHVDLDACIAQIRACVASHLHSGNTGEDDDPRRYG